MSVKYWRHAVLGALRGICGAMLFLISANSAAAWAQHSYAYSIFEGIMFVVYLGLWTLIDRAICDLKNAERKS